MMMVCGCSRWMHTDGIDEAPEVGAEQWLVRFACGCGRRVAALASPADARGLTDRLLWTDDARERLDRMPPYLRAIVQEETERFARERGERLVTWALLHQARQGGAILWEADAERRLERVPAPVRSMARVELERTAMDRGSATVTVALMEEVKARYFGLFANERAGS